jgi:DNA gyrase inhibitor GyrI
MSRETKKLFSKTGEKTGFYNIFLKDVFVTEMEVRIEKLDPMRVAGVQVISASPEIEAWEQLRAWAGPKGLLDDVQKHPVFGFNNPAPSPGRKEYGYEFWIKIEQGVEVGGNVKEKEFPGGLYAVVTHRGFPNPQVWKALWDWVQSGKYRWRKTHELEKPLNPLAAESEMAFDLYLPVE